ncbi:MAG TPA: glycoside hydrolase family 36 protein [Streptosporangiaceae bacterium]
MAAGMRSARARIGWTDGALDLGIDVGGDGTARLTRLAAGGPEPGLPTGLPLVDVIITGAGRSWSGSRYAESVVGHRFRYVRHEEHADRPWRQLRVELDDPVTGLRAEVFYQVLDGCGALRSWVCLTNDGAQPVTVESVTSLLAGALPVQPGDEGLADCDVLWADNDWLAEGRWQRRALRDALPDLDGRVPRANPRGRFGLTSEGSWSSGEYLPMGAVVNRRTGHAWAWQIEHNGGWHWQVGEFAARPGEDGPPGEGGPTSEEGGPPGESVGGAYLALLGPTDSEHQWRLPLAPGASFTTVPVAVAVSDAGFEGAIARLTACRRAIRRPHEDHRRLPVIFNDYMNTLNGDPTTERLLPLIGAAARVGAEYFCIDAGWYADTGEGWWDSVGRWKPSSTRFPNGIIEVLDRIRAEGMVPGLWLEPEVIGVRSPVADQLPAEAFFARGGERVVEHGRYHLDLRHPEAVKHLDEVVDFLVGDLGVGYLKLDYNINAGPGTDTGGLSAGAGLLEHNRAHLQWLDRVLDRHPGLTIENCGSGGMRVDYAMLSHFQLQSTSDQQDHLRYAVIAAAAPAAMAPEQAAIWAYPQPGFTDDEIAFTLCSAMLGRIHLSGHIDQMSRPQRALVAGAVEVYKGLRADLARAVPFWPLGLPRWTDSRVALGLRAPGATYLVAWRRGPVDGSGRHADPAVITLPVRHLDGVAATPEVLYPGDARAEVCWEPAAGSLAVVLPRTPSACLIQLHADTAQGLRHESALPDLVT